MKNLLAVSVFFLTVVGISFGQKQAIPATQEPANEIDPGCGCAQPVQNYQLSLTLSDCDGQFCIGWCVYTIPGTFHEYNTGCIDLIPQKKIFREISDIFKKEESGEVYVNSSISNLEIGNPYISNQRKIGTDVVSLNIDFEGEGLITYKYVLKDMMGQDVKIAGGASLVNNTELAIIDASDLNAGIYNLVISANGNTYSRNIVMQ